MLKNEKNKSFWYKRATRKIEITREESNKPLYIWYFIYHSLKRAEEEGHLHLFYSFAI